MAKFKRGDLVTGRGTWSGTVRSGTFVNVSDDDSEVVIHNPEGHRVYVDRDTVEMVRPALEPGDRVRAHVYGFGWLDGTVEKIRVTEASGFRGLGSFDDVGDELYFDVETAVRLDGIELDRADPTVTEPVSASGDESPVIRIADGEIDAMTLVRVRALREAEKLITGDRNASYGEPTQNFSDIATVWNVLLRDKLKDGAQIDPGDTAALMIGLKLVRRIASDNPDNWVDTIGYAACGIEADVANGRIDIEGWTPAAK